MRKLLASLFLTASVSLATNYQIPLSSGKIVVDNGKIQLSIVPVGAIQMYGAASAPSGWLLCDGGSVSTTIYSKLFSIIGYSYGGAGTNFNVPDLRSRIELGMGSGAGLTSRNLNDNGGVETVTLVSNNIPSHLHSIDIPSTTSSDEGASAHDHAVSSWLGTGSGGATVATYGISIMGPSGTNTVSHYHVFSIASFTTAASGGNAAFSQLPPFRTVNFIIKY